MECVPFWHMAGISPFVTGELIRIYQLHGTSSR
jgi:hypothetical protein